MEVTNELKPNKYNLNIQKLFNFYNDINNDTKEIIDINKNLINLIYKIGFVNYLDYEYLTSILKDNYNKLIFLGKKRNYDVDNQCISQKENKLENLKFIILL